MLILFKYFISLTCLKDIKSVEINLANILYYFKRNLVLRRRQMVLARARARRQAIEENIASNRSTFVVIPKPKDCGKS